MCHRSFLSKLNDSKGGGIMQVITIMRGVLVVGLMAILLGLGSIAQAEEQPGMGSVGPTPDQLTEIQKEIVDSQPMAQPEAPAMGRTGTSTEQPLGVPDAEQSRQLAPSDRDGGPAQNDGTEDRSSSKF
jgi:hypothetical protein